MSGDRVGGVRCLGPFSAAPNNQWYLRANHRLDSVRFYVSIDPLLYLLSLSHFNVLLIFRTLKCDVK